MQREAMIHRAETETSPSEGSPESLGAQQRKRATLAIGNLQDTSDGDVEKNKRKRAKLSAGSALAFANDAGVSPRRTVPTLGAEIDLRGFQQQQGRRHLPALNSPLGGSSASGTGAVTTMDRQRLLLQELMASSDPHRLSLLNSQQHPPHQHANVAPSPWSGDPAAIALGGISPGMMGQQGPADISHYLQLRALNQQFSGSQGYHGLGMGGMGMGMAGYGYGMQQTSAPSFLMDPRHTMSAASLGSGGSYDPGLAGMGPYGAQPSLASLSAMRSALGGPAPAINISGLYGGGFSTGMQPMNNPSQLFALAQAQARGAAMANIGGMAMRLPCVLAQPGDDMKLSSHQVQLRNQIEAFQATDDDVTTHTRGRNKPITIGQIGIRCRHCSHLPVVRRQKGSTYFPATLLGLYQAAQNMSTTHMQCGLCHEMPQDIKESFVSLLTTKPASSGAGRPYWAQSAKKLGLVDTEDGIRFIRDIPPGVRVLHTE